MLLTRTVLTISEEKRKMRRNIEIPVDYSEARLAASLRMRQLLENDILKEQNYTAPDNRKLAALRRRRSWIINEIGRLHTLNMLVA